MSLLPLNISLTLLGISQRLPEIFPAVESIIAVSSSLLFGHRTTEGQWTSSFEFGLTILG